MGYKLGQGLGPTASGITTAISPSSQQGRRGLGFGLKGLERENVKWESEEVNWHVHLKWKLNSFPLSLSLSFLR